MIQSRYHQLLVDYFNQLEVAKGSGDEMQKYQELPWQLIKAGKSHEALDLISSLDFIQKKSELKQALDVLFLLEEIENSNVKLSGEELNKLLRYKDFIKDNSSFLNQIAQLNPFYTHQQAYNYSSINHEFSKTDFQGSHNNIPIFLLEQNTFTQKSPCLIQHIETIARHDILISVSRCRGCIIWNTKTGKMLLDFSNNYSGYLIYLLISKDGKELAVGRENNKCEIWNIENQKILMTINETDLSSEIMDRFPDLHMVIERCNYYYSFNLDNLWFEPLTKWNKVNNQLIHYTYKGKDDSYRSPIITDLSKCKNVGRLWGHESKVTLIEVALNGKIAVTCDEDKICIVWDLAKNSIKYRIECEDEIRLAKITSDGGFVALSSLDKPCTIWDVKTGKRVRELVNDEKIVSALGYSSDDNMIVVGYEDSTCSIWSLGNFQLISVITLRAKATAINWSHNNIYIGDADGRVYSFLQIGGEELSIAAHIGNFKNKYASSSLNIYNKYMDELALKRKDYRRITEVFDFLSHKNSQEYLFSLLKETIPCEEQNDFEKLFDFVGNDAGEKRVFELLGGDSYKRSFYLAHLAAIKEAAVVASFFSLEEDDCNVIDVINSIAFHLTVKIETYQDLIYGLYKRTICHNANISSMTPYDLFLALIVIPLNKLDYDKKYIICVDGANISNQEMFIKLLRIFESKLPKWLQFVVTNFNQLAKVDKKHQMNCQLIDYSIFDKKVDANTVCNKIGKTKNNFIANDFKDDTWINSFSCTNFNREINSSQISENGEKGIIWLCVEEAECRLVNPRYGYEIDRKLNIGYYPVLSKSGNLAILHNQKEVIVWDTMSGIVKRYTPYDGIISSKEISKDDSSIIIAYECGTCILWDYRTNAIIKQFSCLNESVVRLVKLDGDVVLVANNGEIEIWNLCSPTPFKLAQYSDHYKEYVSSRQISINNYLVVIVNSEYRNNNIQIWNLESDSVKSYPLPDRIMDHEIKKVLFCTAPGCVIIVNSKEIFKVELPEFPEEIITSISYQNINSKDDILDVQLVNDEREIYISYAKDFFELRRINEFFSKSIRPSKLHQNADSYKLIFNTQSNYCVVVLYGEAVCCRLDTLERISIEIPGSIKELSKDGEFAFLATYDDKTNCPGFDFWTLKSKEQISSFVCEPCQYLIQSYISDNNERVYFISHRTNLLFEFNNLTNEIKPQTIDGLKIESFKLSVDNKLSLFSAEGGGYVHLLLYNHMKKQRVVDLLRDYDDDHFLAMPVYKFEERSVLTPDGKGVLYLSIDDSIINPTNKLYFISFRTLKRELIYKFVSVENDIDFGAYSYSLEILPNNLAIITIDQAIHVVDILSKSKMTHLINPEPICNMGFANSRLFAVSSYGNLHSYNVDSSKIIHPYIVTLRNNFDFNTKKYTVEYSCPNCGKTLQPDYKLVNAIRYINKVCEITESESPIMHLPDEAWEDKRLNSNCINCGILIKFNPFIVGDKQ